MHPYADMGPLIGRQRNKKRTASRDYGLGARLPAISPQHPTVRARVAGWLPEWLQSSFGNGAVFGACRCHCLARRPLSHPPRRLLLFAAQPPSPSLSLHLLFFLSQHTLWLIIAFTLLTNTSLTASRSFRCWRNSLSTDKHSASIETSIPKLLRENVRQTLQETPASRHQQTRHDRR